MTPGGGRIEGLDLLRGVAIALVMAHHALPGVLPGSGLVGVVMFFSLSGYLITGVLVRRPGLSAFYARRARRLVPPLLALVAGVAAVTLVLDPLHDRRELGWTVLWALTWTGDLPFGHAGDATFHLWTLAVEEQFYLLWPMTLLVLGTRRALAGAAVLAALACVATTWWAAPSYDIAYALPTSWALCFVVGAALQLYEEPLRRWGRALPAATAPGALVILLGLGMVPLRGHALTYLAGGPAIALLTALLVLSWGERTTVTGPARLLVALGTVSYAAYLWNYPLSRWLPALPALVLTLAAAALSWRWIESRLQRRTAVAPGAVAVTA